MTKTNIKDLSIQVHLNGLSFCILNHSTQTVEHLKSISFSNKLLPSELLNNLKEELSTDTVYSDEFNAVLIIHQNELATIVPKDLYNTSNNADYLKFNSKILKTDFITNDVLENLPAVNVYVPYVNINNYIFETFGEFVFKHASTVFIDHIINSTSNSDETEMHVNVNKDAMEVLVVKTKSLLFYNRFEFFTPEDFIYYILFTIEQLNLDTETLKLKFSGVINKDDEKYKLTYKYIRHIDFNIIEKYTFSNSISKEEKGAHYILLNSF
ncbi:DUF3822 family protein [Winogradskyella immobilis]|uniref:DUF3822 family protein n=1 Tax=Winogradskyella immobilis TaxID=2816852 RepID=A0ABS8EQN2_9FLAO|nr:DUF3822 family protein [Winogradskyella immobilis]MCC1485543.1 DUF3822 family protein [Winogradskyella immobilis]MCG0017635.1 DUF3822 family protein [Winogradskyella immobilis]